MSKFKCPACKAKLPDFQQAAGFCPYCDEKWEAASAGAPTPEISGTLDSSHPDWHDDVVPSGNSGEEASPVSTLQFGEGDDGPIGGQHTIDLPASGAGYFAGDSPGVAGHQTLGFDGDDTDVGRTIVPDNAAPVEDYGKTISLDGESEDAGRTIDLPSSEGDGLQTLELTGEESSDKQNNQTLEFSSGDDNQQTIDIDGNAADEFVTLGSKPLSPSGVKKYWGHLGDGSPMQTMRSATVNKAKELGVDLRRRVLSDQEEGSDYAIINQIGKGGMGVVYAAKQKSLRRRVAVKTLKRDIGQKEDDRTKFLSEAVITGVLDHPNIVPIHELGQTEDGTLFYSMKCVTGTEWHKVIRNKSEAENLEILMKVADAVAFAHSKNVIHRDLKPENVMLGEFGEVLVMDWGLAVDLNRKEEFTMGGTPAYMSPEMAKGPLDRIGKCSDIYLLGAILYEIVTGFPPHAASSITECLVAAAQNVIVRSDSTSRLKNIALKAMATSPKLRFNSVALFQEEIRKYQSTAQSIELAHTAQRELTSAKELGSYELFSRAMFGFEDALKLWSENDTAETGVREARIEYAKCALQKGDYDLGLQLVSPTDPSEEPVYLQLVKAKGDAERTARNARLARLVAVASLLVMLVGAGVGMVLINAEKERAVNAERVASEEFQRAEEEAQRANKAAEDAKAAAKLASDEAEKARLAEMEATAQKETADHERVIADREREKAELLAKDLQKALEDARQQRQEAITQENRARFAGIFSAVGLAQSKIESNDISSALDLLRDVPPEHRGWEWKHLAYLCHPSVPSVDFGALTTSVAISPSGDRTAIGTDGQGVYVYAGDNATQDNQPQRIELPDCRVTALRFSPDGKRLWIGTDHSQKYLLVWDFQKDPVEVRDQKFENYNPTRIVRSIEFVPDPKKEALIVISGGLLKVSRDTLQSKEDISALHMFDVAISPNGNEYVQTDEDRGRFSIKRRQFSNNEVIGELQLDERANWCEYLTNGRILFAVADGTLRVWYPEKNREEQVASLSSQINQLRFDPKRDLLAVALGDSSLKLFHVSTAQGELRDYKTLRGHGGPILDCAYHPTLDQIVSVSEDGTARFWDFPNYVERSEWEQEGPVLWAAFGGNGQEVITGDATGSVQTWMSAPGTESPLARLKMGDWERQNFTELATAVPMANGKFVVTADPSAGIDVWNLKSKQIVAHHDTHSESRRTAVIPGTERFVFVDAEAGPMGKAQTVLRFSNAKGDVGYSLPYHVGAEQILSLVAAPSGRRFAVLSPVRIDVFELPAEENGSPRVIWEEDVSGVQQIGFVADDVLAIGNNPGSQEGFVSLVNINDGKVVRRFPNVEQGLPFLLFSVSPDNSHLAIVYHNISVNEADQVSQLCLYNAVSGSLVGKTTCQGLITSPSVSLDNDVVYFVQSDDNGYGVGQWTVGGNKNVGLELARVGRKGTEDERQVVWVDAFPADDDLIQVNFSNRDVEIWNVAEGMATARLAATRPVIFSAYIDDDRKIVSVHRDGLVRTWDVAQGQQLQQWDVGYQVLNGAALNGNLLAVGGDAGEVAVVDLSKSDTPKVFPTGEEQVDSLAWYAEGDHRLLVGTSAVRRQVDGSGEPIGTLKIMDSRNGEQIGKSVAAHSGRYRSLAVSQMGGRIAAGSTDKQIRLWFEVPAEDLPAAEPLVVRGHATEVSAVTFSHNGQRLVSGGADGGLTVWFVDRPRATGQDGEATETDLLVKEFVPLKGHRNEITSIAFSADDERLLTSSMDRRTILWYSTDLPQRPQPGQENIARSPVSPR